MKTISIYSRILLLLSIFCLVKPALAEDFTFSDNEKVIFGFFTLAHKTPDYETWVRNTPAYKQAAPETRENTFQQELLRLKWGFGSFDPARTPLHLKTDALLQLKKDGAYNVLSFKFASSGTQETPYFPYPYGKEWIALVANDLGAYTSVPLDAPQNAKARDAMKEGAVYPGKVSLDIRMMSADGSKPMSMDGLDQWLMLGKIAAIELSLTDPATGAETRLFTYTNPETLPHVANPLLMLRR